MKSLLAVIAIALLGSGCAPGTRVFVAVPYTPVFVELPASRQAPRKCPKGERWDNGYCVKARRAPPRQR